MLRIDELAFRIVCGMIAEDVRWTQVSSVLVAVDASPSLSAMVAELGARVNKFCDGGLMNRPWFDQTDFCSLAATGELAIPDVASMLRPRLLPEPVLNAFVLLDGSMEPSSNYHEPTYPAPGSPPARPRVNLWGIEYDMGYVTDGQYTQRMFLRVYTRKNWLRGGEPVPPVIEYATEYGVRRRLRDAEIFAFLRTCGVLPAGRG